MRPILVTLLALLLGQSAAALPKPPHDLASGITCGDCHLPYGGLSGEPAAYVTTAAGTTTSLVDGARSWAPGAWVGGYVSFTSGANTGLYREVTANTATSLQWSVPLPEAVAAGAGYRIGKSSTGDLQTMCQGCHNPTGMAPTVDTVTLHTTREGTVGCGKCHEPHNLEPNTGLGAGLIRHSIRWPGAKNPVAYTGPSDSLVERGGSYNGLCETCHTKTAYHRNNPSGDHGHDVTGDCQFCHAHSTGFKVRDVAHTSAPAAAWVKLFETNGHDDAGGPEYEVYTDCGTCHVSDLRSAHGQQCFNCHPTPYQSLGTWNRGCQQGGCHSVYHDTSQVAHYPFEDDCNKCHPSSTWWPTQSMCRNCHAAPSYNDLTPPVTTSDAKASYSGPATIRYSATDGGKVASVTTFSRLDGGVPVTGSTFYVDAPGAHVLEFWSKDTAGNVETPKVANFTIIQDTTAPVTTSNARSVYWTNAYITLTATDASELGVKTTFYELTSSDPAQSRSATGTWVALPAAGTSPGTYTYQLQFWSEDWSGNVETPKTVSFTLTLGTGTIRLIWGMSTTNHTCNTSVTGPTHPDDWADWTIRRGDWRGPIIATGSGSMPGWDGIDDVVVPVHGTPYYVDIWWWDSYHGWDDNTVHANVYVTTPGEIVCRGY